MKNTASSLEIYRAYRGNFMKISYNLEPRKNLIGERLCQLRKDRKLSQRKLAIKLQQQGYSFTELTILRIEKGQRLATDIEVMILCRFFEVDPNTMFGYTGSTKEQEDKRN